jgi:hypothetical protein
LRLASLLIERAQAAFHSAFDICVSRSQYAMQSCRRLPPPPAVLGAASVGLVLEEAGEDIVSVLAAPPAVGVVVAIGGGSGATDCDWGAGAPIADAGVGGGAAGGAGSVDTALMLEAGTDVVEVAVADTANGAKACCACTVPSWTAAGGALARM